MHSFDEVLEHFGGITGLANALGITSQAISQWEGEFPPQRAYQVEVISRGKFKADRLPVRQADQRSH